MKTITEKLFASPVFAVGVFVVSLIINILAGAQLLGGNTTAEVSDAYPNLFAPAGVTFAIWGVIYMLLAGFCVRLFVKPGHQSKETSELVRRTTIHFTVVGLLNAAWLFAWQYRVLWLSVLLIVGMLVVLARVSDLLYKYKKRLSNLDWLTLKVPFGVYFGWITIATIANITTFLVSIGWSGWGVSAELWTVIILIVGATIGIASALRRRDWVYLGVFVWAYYGIWLKHTSSDGYGGMYPAVLLVLTVLIPVFVVAASWIAYRWPKGLPRA